MEPFIRSNVSNACDMNLKINVVTTCLVLGHIVAIFQQLDALFTNALVSPSQVMFFKP